MKRAIGVAWLGLVAAVLVPGHSARLDAQGLVQSWNSQPRAGACFYLDADYRGDYFCVNAGESQANLGDRYNDKISSIRVFGGVQVVIFEDASFGGASRTIIGDTPNLDDWNDRISSVRVSRGSQPEIQRGGPFGAFGRGNPVPAQACFFTGANYAGERLCVNSGESLPSMGERFNDRISSVRLSGGVQVVVYENENFGGLNRTITRDMPDLCDFNDTISSVLVAGGQPQGQRGAWYGAPAAGNEPVNGACFYMDADFGGEGFCMNSGEDMRELDERYNDKISSIRVFGRVRVLVYEDGNFSGSSRTVTSDAANLGDFNDRISSIRIR